VYTLELLIAAFLGTTAMTACMYLYGFITKQPTYVIHLLSQMLIGSRKSYTNLIELLIGTFAHYGVGLFFTLVYASLQNDRVFDWNMGSALAIGLITGMVAVVVWLTYLKVHHCPFKTNLIHFCISLSLSHVVFAIMIFLYMNS
jgi:hypothetical protein